MSSKISKAGTRGRWRRVVLAVIGVAVASTLLVPATADAATYTPQSVCGAGYYVQRSHQLNGARVYQLYNGDTNCVVTIKTARQDVKTLTAAGLQVAGSDWKFDVDYYKQYAGPVKQYAKGKCVRFYGYHGGENFTSSFGNCG